MQASSDCSSENKWVVFGKKFPKSEIVYFSQIIILYTIIICSIYNLTTSDCDHLNTLWITHLSSCVGYLLPNPTIQKKDNVLHNTPE